MTGKRPGHPAKDVHPEPAEGFSSNSPSPSPGRCRLTFADGRRCALPANPQSDSGLCYTHAHAPHRRLRRSDLIRALTPRTGTPSEADIHRFRAKLSIALAEGLITRQDFGIFTQLSNLMLQCQRHAKDRNFPEPIGDEWAFVSSLLNDDEGDTNENEKLPQPSRLR